MEIKERRTKVDFARQMRWLVEEALRGATEHGYPQHRIRQIQAILEAAESQFKK